MVTGESKIAKRRRTMLEPRFPAAA